MSWVKFRSDAPEALAAHRAADGKLVGILWRGAIALVHDDRLEVGEIHPSLATDVEPLADIADLPAVVRGTLPPNFRFPTPTPKRKEPMAVSTSIVSLTHNANGSVHVGFDGGRGIEKESLDDLKAHVSGVENQELCDMLALAQAFRRDANLSDLDNVVGYTTTLNLGAAQPIQTGKNAPA